jgi:hypothetical protein
MTFEGCVECAGLVAEMLQVALIGLAAGIPLSIFSVVRARRQPWCVLALSAKRSD